MPTARRRLALALAAVSVVAVPSAAGATTGATNGSRELVVEGSRSASVDFQVTDRPMQLRDMRVRVTGRSNVAVLISSVDGRASAASLGVLRSTQLAAEPVLFGFPELQPGRYRVRLVTSAPTRVTFQVPDGTGRVLRPRTPITATWRSDRRAVEAGRSTAELRLAGAVPAGRISLLGYVVTGQRLEQTSACLVEPGRRCQGLPLRPPIVSDLDPGVGVPTTSDRAFAGSIRPAAVRRDALVSVDGYRTTAGELRSVLVTFPG